MVTLWEAGKVDDLIKIFSEYKKEDALTEAEIKKLEKLMPSEFSEKEFLDMVLEFYKKDSKVRELINMAIKETRAKEKL